MLIRHAAVLSISDLYTILDCMYAVYYYDVVWQHVLLAQLPDTK